MKSLAILCIIGSIIALIAGLVSKYVVQIGALQPASYLLIIQVLLLFGANFLLLEISKK